MPMLYHFAKGFLMNLIKFFQKKDNTPKKLGYTNTHNIESPSEHTTTKKEKRYKNLGIQILICVLFIVIIGLLVYIMLSRYEANYKETENTETSEDTHHEYKQQCIIKQQDSIDSNYSSYDGFNAMFSESLVYSLVDHESFNDLRLPPISSYEQIQQIEKETKQKETSIGYEIFYELFGENLNRSFNSTLKDSYFSKKYFNELHSNTLTFDDDKENIREARQCNGKECQIKGYDTKGNLLYNIHCRGDMYHGKQSFYGENGNTIMELNFNKGKLDGNQIRYENNGEIQTTLNITDSKLNGEVKIKNGQQSLTAFFQKGKLQNAMQINEENVAKALFNFNDKGKVHGMQKIWMIKDTTPAYLGVSLRNLTTWDDIYNLYRITQGALITDVIEGFAGAKYGIRQNDVIVAINNIKIGNSEDAKNILSTLYAKDKVIIKIYRPSTDKYYNATMTLDADPSYKKTGELQLVVEAQYDNNHPLSYKEWYENGKLKKEGNFNIKGVLDGVQREWEENGNIIRHEIYENGERIQIIR